MDPLAESMPNYGGYVYTFNNPINFTDPTGMIGEEVIITGEKKQETFDQLQSSTKLKLTMDNDSGRVSATGKASSKSDKLLKEAIDSKSVQVNVKTTSSNYYIDSDTPMVIGAYEGSIISEARKVIASQTINPTQAGIADEFYKMGNGTSTKHEVMEAYIGAVDSPGISVNQNFNYDKNSVEYKAYLNAHYKAMGYDKNFVQPSYSDFKNNLYFVKPNPKIPSSPFIQLFNNLR